MTAPDVNADVRARFEAWAVQKGLPVEKEMARKGVLYESFVTGFAWLAWKQVHADLSGEVRELVEDAGRALAAWDSTTLPRVNDGMLQERMESLRCSVTKLNRNKAGDP